MQLVVAVMYFTYNFTEALLRYVDDCIFIMNWSVTWWTKGNLSTHIDNKVILF